MKRLITIAIFCLLAFKSAMAQKTESNVITTDIGNFWAAFDKVTSTKDSAMQYTYLNQLFIEKGTPGLKAIMAARDYTAKSYIDAVNNYPLFWKSIRANTSRVPEFASAIAANVLKLKKLYPELKPAKIYFTIGALRTGGTTLNDMVLIGSEIAMADENTVSSEFPSSLSNLKTLFKTNPINMVVFTNVHEYVHTQQKTGIGNCLLAQSFREGVAEFVAVKATGQATTLPAVSYGKNNGSRVKELFASQMFNPSNGFWLYTTMQNEFGTRDLGYYVGYAICEGYYNNAKDKKQAIKKMIELNYNNEADLSQFIDQSGYFSKPVQTLKADYEKSRPTVTGIKQFKNNDMNVSAALTQITVEFSAPMDKRNRNFELGPLGENNLLRVKRFTGFSEDGKSATFEVELKPGRHYQLVIGNGFISTNAISLKPYLVDFSTTDK